MGKNFKFGGRLVTSIEFGYTIALAIDNTYEVRTGSSFLFNTDDGDFPFAPDGALEGELDRLVELVGVAIKSAVADESGELVLNFENRSTLRIPFDEFYEAWTVSGPRGFLVVCTPGGELAIWDEQPAE